jgi:para-nitrobenzyl esterase
MAIGADMAMHEPAHFAAAAVRRADVPAWIYRFSYAATSARPRATAQVHAGELPWLFDNLAVACGDAVSAEDQLMADAFHRSAVNFATTGDPNGACLPTWPRAEPDQYRLMDFTLDDGHVYGADPRQSVRLVARAHRRHEARVAAGR